MWNFLPSRTPFKSQGLGPKYQISRFFQVNFCEFKAWGFQRLEGLLCYKEIQYCTINAGCILRTIPKSNEFNALGRFSVISPMFPFTSKITSYRRQHKAANYYRTSEIVRTNLENVRLKQGFHHSAGLKLKFFPVLWKNLWKLHSTGNRGPTKTIWQSSKFFYYRLSSALKASTQLEENCKTLKELYSF